MIVEHGGARLAVAQAGDPAAPTVLLVHGYPDTHRVWDEVAELLAGRFHVVRYDTRGVGASTAPEGRDAFRLRALAGDLAAVIDAVSPDAPAHLVGHDWGAFQCWEALAGDARVGSFTALAGPRIDGVGGWALRRLAPWRVLEVADQARRSLYIAAAQLPRLPEAALRRAMGDGWPRMMRTLEGIEPREGHPAATIASDAIAGLALYRTNMSLRAPAAPPADVPVQLLVPTRDRYISTALYADAERWATRLWRRDLRAGHWAQRSHPEAVARAIAELVDHAEGAPEAPSLRRARWGARARLAVVTGAGSGIGRATALALAAEDHEVVAADIDLASAQATADAAPGIHAVELDVSDADALDAFAFAVEHDHGVPEVVVNNAGIGMGGAFLDTARADWEQIVGVNFWGVLHGSRLFAAQMAAAGVEGQIVNVASAAAYTPQRSMSAYATTKAAVLMLSECMRADLADKGIGVTAICPGIIDTNIVRTARLVGVEPEQARRMNEAGARAYRLRGYGPERVADAILHAIRTNPAVLPVSPEAHALQALNRFAPGVLRRLARVSAPVTP